MLINKTIKADKEEWDILGRICADIGSKRSTLIRVWVKRFISKHK